MICERGKTNAIHVTLVYELTFCAYFSDLRAKIAPAESVMRVTPRTSQSGKFRTHVYMFHTIWIHSKTVFGLNAAVIFSKRRSSSINGPGKGRRSNESKLKTVILRSSNCRCFKSWNYISPADHHWIGDSSITSKKDGSICVSKG